MAVGADLVARSAILKQELVNLAEGPEFAQDLQQFITERFAGATPNNDQRSNAVDSFILHHPLADGRPFVEHFVESHPELSKAEREMVLAWRLLIEGVFVIQRRSTDSLLLDNLVDELMYTVRANTVNHPFAKLKEGAFLVGRVVPIQDEWLLSGPYATYTKTQREKAYRIAAELAEANPPLVYRNPANVVRAWEQQRNEREDFIAFFGADLVVLPGDQADERMRAFAHYQLHEARDAAGKTVAERAKQAYGKIPPIPDPDLPEDLVRMESVGVIYDEVDGLKFLPNFRPVQEAFAETELGATHLEGVRGYLEDDSISPRALQRLGDAAPERASVVLQRVLGEPEFSWEKDGEALLQRMKASYYETPVMPTIVPLSEELARARLGVTPTFVEQVAQRAAVVRTSKRKKRK